MCVIFDLDQTLVDTSAAMELRKQRVWREVIRQIPNFKVYEGVQALLEKLSQNSIPFAIVTTSPSIYAIAIIDLYGWKPNAVVCYHDTVNHKPHPEPLQKAITILNANPKNTVSVGDDVKDVWAGKAANAITVGALWGSEHPASIIDSNPTYICKSIKELSNILATIFRLQ